MGHFGLAVLVMGTFWTFQSGYTHFIHFRIATDCINEYV